MLKTIYLVRHSGPFVEIANYDDNINILWEEYNKNMILSVDGEKNAEKLCNIEELKNIDEVYASNSVRAIATAKYIAAENKVKVKLDSRINERIFGIDYLNQIPDDFNKKSFDNKAFKLGNGESFNDVDKRFNDFINQILNSKNEKTVVVIHGLILLSFLETICKFDFDGNKFKIMFNDRTVLNGNPKSPDVYKITYNLENEIVNIENIIL